MKYLEFSSGIYCIYNAENTPLYIGAAVDLKKRYNSEKTLLERNMHKCYELQAYYNQNPELRFVPVYYCHESRLEFNKFKLILAMRPEFNEITKTIKLDAGEFPAIIELLMQEFAGKKVLMTEMQKFLKDQGETINKVQLGRLINSYGVASVERNWSENGRHYYRFGG